MEKEEEEEEKKNFRFVEAHTLKNTVKAKKRSKKLNLAREDDFMRDDWISESMEAFIKIADVEDDLAVQTKNFQLHSELGKKLKGESLFS